MFNREIFRKKALDKLSTPDDLDELLQVNSRFSWLLLISLLCLILGGLGWGIFGKIVNKVPMTGASQQVDPPLSLIACGAGQVDSIFHNTGDRVFKGQPIARYIPVNGSSAVYIVSPCDGELIELNISIGGFMASGAIMAKIGSNKRGQATRPEFLLFVSEKRLFNLTIGQSVNIAIQGLESETIRVNTRIVYIGKLPASNESISSVILDSEEAAKLKSGNYYLVRTIYLPNSAEPDLFNVFSARDLYGKVCRGEAITSQNSPIAYLLSPSKHK
ncbi:MAG: hypothetical protein NT004_06140 [Bacteroidetes bacterium]|nr:hypothetical protein [Bacteroidota bacterium]